MFSAAIVCLLAQQIDQSALEKAMAADAAAKAATAPADDAGFSAGGLRRTPVPGVTVAPEAATAADATAGGGAWAAQQGARAPGGSLLNPALSFILDGSFGYYGAHTGDFVALGLPAAGDDPSVSRQGFDVQEIELAAQSAIDPYFEGLDVSHHPQSRRAGGGGGLPRHHRAAVQSADQGGDLPLAVRTQQQPAPARAVLHPPAAHDGAALRRRTGCGGRAGRRRCCCRLPWFATLYAEAFSIAAPEDPAGVSTFGGGVRLTPANLTYTAVLEQFFELAESHSLLVGLNFATGRSVDCLTAAPCVPLTLDGPRSYLYGADLYYKWKPANVAQSYASFQWTTEFYARTLADGGPTEGAGYSEAVVQIARRFYLGGRFDLTGLPSGPDVPRRYGGAASVTFAPSEFSRLRLYAQELGGPGVAATTVGFLQVEYAMGAHGAHPF